MKEKHKAFLLVLFFFCLFNVSCTVELRFDLTKNIVGEWEEVPMGMYSSIYDFKSDGTYVEYQYAGGSSGHYQILDNNVRMEPTYGNTFYFTFDSETHRLKKSNGVEFRKR